MELLSFMTNVVAFFGTHGPLLKTNVNSISRSTTTLFISRMDRRTALKKQLEVLHHSAWLTSSIIMLVAETTPLDSAAASTMIATTSDHVPKNLEEFLFELSSSSSSLPFQAPLSAVVEGSNDVWKLSSGDEASLPSLVSGKWPDAPSPLPTAVHTAAELTAPLKAEIQQEFRELTDLEKSLQERLKQKTVDPRSHGY
jgi:hypothetical protein